MPQRGWSSLNFEPNFTVLHKQYDLVLFFCAWKLLHLWDWAVFKNDLNHRTCNHDLRSWSVGLMQGMAATWRRCNTSSFISSFQVLTPPKYFFSFQLGFKLAWNRFWGAPWGRWYYYIIIDTTVATSRQSVLYLAEFCFDHARFSSSLHTHPIAKFMKHYWRYNIEHMCPSLRGSSSRGSGSLKRHLVRLFWASLHLFVSPEDVGRMLYLLKDS